MNENDSVDPQRSRVLAELVGTWVLPYWLERQASPSSPEFVATGGREGVVNVCHRERVPVGTLDGGVGASVDPRGLVTPVDRGWSLDWWVGGEDRWYLPSREVAVRQRAIDAAPLVSTALRTAAGDVVQDVWAFRDADAGDVISVEFTNNASVPVALALAIRPYGPDGATRIAEIAVDGREIVVDGDLGCWLPRPAARSAVSNLAGGDVASVVLGGLAREGSAGSAACPAGFAQAAVVLPLAHAATLRVLIPVDPLPTGAGRPEVVPPAATVARGWTAHAGRGLRIDLPEPHVESAFGAARAQVLMASAELELAGRGRSDDTVAIVGALDRLGLHDEAARILATLPRGQGRRGRLGGDDPAAEATAAILVAAGRHWRYTRDVTLLGELAGPLAAGAHHHRGSGLRRLRGASVPAPPGELGWRLKGISDVADALEGCGQAEAAEALAHLAVDVRVELEGALEALLAAPGKPGRLAELASIAHLVARLGVLDAGSVPAETAIEALRATLGHENALARTWGSTGLSPELTALVAGAELRRGESTALGRLEWLVAVAGGRGCWPELVHARHAGGCGGSGASATAAAAFVELVCDLVLREDRSRQALVILSLLPPSWRGAGVEVHGAPTGWGRFSFALRWHGENPALLWELEPHPGGADVLITAPGLDPGWSSTERRGEALLASGS